MPQKFQNLKNSHRFTKSSKKWLTRQLNDPFVEKARQEGWRSRAAFKIIEIDEKFKIFKKNKSVVDLGSAPGGWSQYAVTKVGENKVVALDLLEMSPIAGVHFLQQDFLAEETLTKIKEILVKISKKPYCNVLLSDMASNTTGNKTVDHLQIIDLLEDVLSVADKILKNDGHLVSKIFQGGSSDIILQQLKQKFKQVKYFKPKSSRQDSSEHYLIGLNFLGNQNLELQDS
ncbi:MAG: RlmE family RNA methyltransferase [Proteobacteria bacterium]|nr:RlmE family RNA methyltransferase [Pseudomonadota bacterium]